MRVPGRGRGILPLPFDGEEADEHRGSQRLVEVEVGASSRVAEFEEMVSVLQKEKKDLEESLASVRISAETSIKQLDEAHDLAKAAEDAARTAEERRRGG